MSGSHDDTQHHISAYKKVAGALAVLTLVTVLASYLNVAVALGVVIALIIAVTKGSLVAGVFMHLKDEHSTWLMGTLVLTVFFWFVLMLLPLLGHSNQLGEHYTLPNADAPHVEDAAH